MLRRAFSAPYEISTCAILGLPGAAITRTSIVIEFVLKDATYNGRQKRTVTLNFIGQLSAERERLALLAGGGIAAFAAGAIYWAALFVLGLYASPTTWCLIAFVTTGLIFPLALLLQRPTRSNLMVRESPVANAGMVGFVNFAVGWAITIPAFHTNPQLVPLTLGIGMSLHFASIGWSFGSRAMMFHPLVRALVLVFLWYVLPAHRFTAIPLAVALIYLVTIVLVLKELSSFRQSAMASRLT